MFKNRKRGLKTHVTNGCFVSGSRVQPKFDPLVINYWTLEVSEVSFLHSYRKQRRCLSVCLLVLCFPYLSLSLSELFSNGYCTQNSNHNPSTLHATHLFHILKIPKTHLRVFQTQYPQTFSFNFSPVLPPTLLPTLRQVRSFFFLRWNWHHWDPDPRRGSRTSAATATSPGILFPLLLIHSL